MNIDKDFTFQTIKLTPDYDGEAIATLISSKRNLGNRKSVLYLHGYNDYFFHTMWLKNSTKTTLILCY
jgi:hypothetical protein